MDYIYIGKFLGTHGLKGEIRFKTDFKYIEKVLKKDFLIYVGSDKKEEKIAEFKTYKDGYLLLLDGISNIDLICHYVNKSVYVKRSSLNLLSSEYVMEDFLNKQVYFKDKFLGVVESITDYGSSNYVMEILGDREILVPYNDNFIDSVSDKIYLKNLEDLINED